MPKYQKKPVVIEAFQMTKERRWDNSEWPNWLNYAWNLEPSDPGAVFCKDGSEELFINTLEGTHEITWDDFIIQGIKGELYPCKPDIFWDSYVEVPTCPTCKGHGSVYPTRAICKDCGGSGVAS